MKSVDDVVESRSDLFGSGEIRTIGTFSNHAIVMNDSGEFFRADFSVNEESGALELGEVERIDVPVREVSELSGEVRVESRKAVEALLCGKDDEANCSIGSLYEMIRSGVRLTAEGVEDDFLGMFDKDNLPEWMVGVHDNRDSMSKFVGAESKQDLPAPKFGTLVESDEVDEEGRYRKVVSAALRRLNESMVKMHHGIAFARLVDEEYHLRIDESKDAEMVAEDFFEFVDGYSVFLESAMGIVEDAIAVSKDGTLRSLARIHDGVAASVRDMGLAAAFAEKFARRFDSPQMA